MPGLIRRRVLVDGRVQGVYFRDSARAVAGRHGVSGWVRNLVDGRVELVLEGEPAAVEAVLAWCHEGPPRAVVTGVWVSEEEPAGETGFGVR